MPEPKALEIARTLTNYIPARELSQQPCGGNGHTRILPNLKRHMEFFNARSKRRFPVIPDPARKPAFLEDMFPAPIPDNRLSATTGESAAGGCVPKAGLWRSDDTDFSRWMRAQGKLLLPECQCVGNMTNSEIVAIRARQQTCGPRRIHPRGFALVVTISLMVLLAILAVGLLSLSSVALRSSSQAMARAEAQANARLALMMAIGELQKELGPDQRICAQAEILDKTPATGKVEDVANPHYLGVWDSWNTWLTDKRKSLSIQDTYKRGRDPSLFRGWLVSDPRSADYESAISGAAGDDGVVLCGPGSAGADPADHVRASRIQVRQGNRTTGSYAWWISDESQKARLDLKARDDAGSAEEAQAFASHTGRAGIETMERMDDFDTTPVNLGKMVTTGQASLSAAAAAQHFHDLTAYSLGLLTDVRSGGFKSDLNLAFEAETEPEEMDEADIFGGRPFDAPIRPMTGELAKIVPQNPYVAPMSWRQLREYYRLYRPFSDSHSKHPLEWSGGEPHTRRYIMRGDTKNELDAGGYARQLVLLRETWILATYSKSDSTSPGGIAYYVFAVPISYWWNPYNVTMKVDSTEISSTGALYEATGIRQRVYRGNTIVRDTMFPDVDYNAQGRQFKGDNHNILANQVGNRMIPVGKGGSGSIDFLPGEVRVFSTDDSIDHNVNYLGSADAMGSRHFLATPGYTPVQATAAGVLRGLRYRVYPGSGSGEVSLSLRLGLAKQNISYYIGLSRKTGFMESSEEVFGAGRGMVLSDGTQVTKKMEGSWQDIIRCGANMIDWVSPGELDDAWIVNDSATDRAKWGAPDSTPMPIGIFSIVAKSAEQLAYESSAGFAKDYRNRSWLHAPPTRLANLLMNPENLNRSDSPYQLHFRPVNGDQEVSQYLQADGPDGYFGGGYTPAAGQTRLAMLSLPVAPVMNLGSLAGVRVDHARSRILQADDHYSNPSVDKSGLASNAYKYKHLAASGGGFGVGIGNGYAHPMIEQDKVYSRNNLGDDPGWDGRDTTKLPVCDDYWDHLFLANEELWDSWFFSGLAPEVNHGQVTKSISSVANDFFAGESTLLPPYFQPDLRGKTPAELAELVETSSAASGGNGWERIASHILNRGQFNVNSTSKEAWKALLMSLADRPLAYNDTGSPTVIDPDSDNVSLSRYPLANSATPADGPGDENAWRGIRKLTESQIDKLAEEIVRQVKERGPFLNMAEFINRRLSDDDLGVTGALQAAIDWDDFNAGYNGTTSGSGESINKAYKRGEAMIATANLPAKYPNPKAATGSRYAGIPGYVMQSDILQGISSSLWRARRHLPDPRLWREPVIRWRGDRQGLVRGGVAAGARIRRSSRRGGQETAGSHASARRQPGPAPHQPNLRSQIPCRFLPLAELERNLICESC